MDDRTTKAILRRLNDLERNTPQLRRGEVTDDSPLNIELGASGVSYTSCTKLAGGSLSIGDQVMCLVVAGDLLVLGELA